jgi:uncharacterized repeat protein (TIGR03803 family)
VLLVVCALQGLASAQPLPPDSSQKERIEVTGIAEGIDGALFISACYGGEAKLGGIYQRPRGGQLTLLYSFDEKTGTYPLGLTLGWDGAFYGTTAAAGEHGFGTAFRITRAGRLTILHAFTSEQGGPPSAGLTQALDGNLYGVTGGVYQRAQLTGQLTVTNYGSVFSLTPEGEFRILHEFAGRRDGARPAVVLMQASDGLLYGTTSELKSVLSPRTQNLTWGSVFRISTRGDFRTVYRFTGWRDGGNPHGRLVEGRDGALYGTTQVAAESGRPAIAASVFRLEKAGDFETLNTFTRGGAEGEVPVGGLSVGWLGLYGVTQEGADNAAGALYRIAPSGRVSVVYAFEPSVCGAAVLPLTRSWTGYYGATDHCLFHVDEEGGVSILDTF